MLLLLLQSLESEEDRNIFTRIYLENEQLVFKTAEMLLNNKSDRDDCAQETFLELIKSFEKFKKIEPKKQQSYILTICRRCVYKMNASGSTEAAVTESLTTEPSVGFDLSLFETRRIVEEIKKLDEKYRIPLSMKYTEGMSTKEIASFLMISQNAVKQRLFRGRKMIIKALEEETK